MIRNNDIQALSQVSDDLSFLVDQNRFNQAFKEVNKTEEKVLQICSALKELVQKLFNNPQLK
jgi:predicted glycosyltransferase involved in capsule biosynthesis